MNPLTLLPPTTSLFDIMSSRNEIENAHRHIEIYNIRCRSTRPDWRDHFFTNRYGEYKLNRAWWECKIWPKPPPAIDRRLPTDEGVRF